MRTMSRCLYEKYNNPSKFLNLSLYQRHDFMKSFRKIVIQFSIFTSKLK
ncbi:hypothetical protein VCHA28FP16_170026 [Vibrio chagasii]|nr:hypothetical protein VCHA28FP16_170026 [Vibrio chagasii]